MAINSVTQTVGQLLEHLKGLDPNKPVKIKLSSEVLLLQNMFGNPSIPEDLGRCVMIEAAYEGY